MSDVYPRTDTGTTCRWAGVCVYTLRFGGSGFRACPGLTALRVKLHFKSQKPRPLRDPTLKCLYAVRQQQRDISLRTASRCMSPKSNEFKLHVSKL